MKKKLENLETLRDEAWVRASYWNGNLQASAKIFSLNLLFEVIAKPDTTLLQKVLYLGVPFAAAATSEILKERQIKKANKHQQEVRIFSSTAIKEIIGHYTNNS